MKILNQGFDHVEFVVQDIRHHALMYSRMGFQKIGQRELPNDQGGTYSELYAQGWVRILLTQEKKSGSGQKSTAVQFHQKHGDGICTLAIEVDDATEAYEETTARGAKGALEPQTYESEFGKVIRSEIHTLGDFRYAFIERKQKKVTTSKRNIPIFFDQALNVDRLESPSPLGLRVIDHLTNNVGIGEMKNWVDWYKQVFDFIVTRHFDIRTPLTGLVSDVVQSRDYKIKVPINEATDPKSQIQEFVERFNGTGVQHLALLTDNILMTVPKLRKNKFTFLSVPATYYEGVPKRVPKFEEDLEDLQAEGILIDGEKEGYLLQIFTEELVGPFFLEFIQRKGNQGFGEGNFRALFEAIERDQMKRGVLKAQSS